MANVRLPDATREAMVEVIDDLIDAGAAGGTIKMYTATQPASANTAISDQTLLATLTFSTTSRASDNNAGELTFATITDGTGLTDGTVTWARIADSNGVTVFDCDVNTSGATINLNSVGITTGSTVSITSFKVTVPAS